MATSLARCRKISLLGRTLVGLLLSASLGVAASQGPAEDREQYRYRAVFVESAPTIDGELSDPVWEQAEVLDTLVQQIPHFGEPSTERTVVRVVYDSTAIYIGVYCYDSGPAQRAANTLSYRDEQLHQKDDAIRFAFDPFHDHRRGFVVATNPLGTKQDGFVDNRAYGNEWDEVWDVRTRQYADGWSAEFRIPFRILRFPTGSEEQTWGFQVMRTIQANREQAFWAPHPPRFQLFAVDYYGHIEGIAPVRSGRNMQFVPYLLSETTRSTGIGGLNSGMEWGGDMKLVAGSKLALDLTYNTNFSQVEADDQQTNLTRFSLFFPEKREFFLENSQIFDFGISRDTMLFFSRRIGLKSGKPVPLLGGARLTGKLGAFDLGLISTQTESVPEDPSTNLSAARLRWNVGERAFLGTMFTSVSAKDKENRAFGVDSLLWFGRNWRWESFFAALDDPLLTKRPVSYSSALLYDTDLWNIAFRELYVDDQFNPSLGFVRRQNIRKHYAKLGRGWRLNRPWARKLDVSGEMNYITDRQGELDTRQWVFAAAQELHTGDRLTLTLERNFERLSNPFRVNPREGEEVIIAPGDYAFNRWEIKYDSYQGRPWLASARFQGGEYYGGDRTGFVLSGTWRASPHLLLRGDYERNDISLPRLPQGEFQTHLWRARVSLPFSVRVRTDAFVQWNSLNQDGDRELNTQVRFHLIYARDSNFFVVFTDQKLERANGRVQRDQAVQIKLTYRLYR